MFSAFRFGRLLLMKILNSMKILENQIPWDILLLDIEHFLPRRGII